MHGPHGGPAPYVLFNPSFLHWRMSAGLRHINASRLTLLSSLADEIIASPLGYPHSYNYAAGQIRNQPVQIQAAFVILKATFKALATPTHLQARCILSVAPAPQAGSSAETAYIAWLPDPNGGAVPGVIIVAGQVVGSNGNPLIIT